ncbi:hypothetical protein TKK_0014020 [Trichogramma kaykai]
MHLIKTKTTNRLQFMNLRAELLTSEYIKDQGGLLNFEPDENLLDLTIKIKSRYPVDTKTVAQYEQGIIENTYDFTEDFTKEYLRECKLDSIYYKRPQKTNYINKQNIESSKWAPITSLVNALLCPNENEDCHDVNKSEEQIAHGEPTVLKRIHDSSTFEGM